MNDVVVRLTFTVDLFINVTWNRKQNDTKHSVLFITLHMNKNKE